MQFEMVLEILGVAVSLGGWLGALLPRERTRIILIVVATFLAFTSVWSLYLNRQHRASVEATEEDIQSMLGSETKSFEQLYGSLYRPEISLANEALDALVSRKKVGQRVLEVEDSQDRKFLVRVYYLMSPARADSGDAQ
jgi:hypothetical protein